MCVVSLVCFTHLCVSCGVFHMCVSSGGHGQPGSAAVEGGSLLSREWEGAPLLATHEQPAVELVPTPTHHPMAAHVSEPCLHSRSPSPGVAPPLRAHGVGDGAVTWWRVRDVARLWRRQRPLYVGVWAHVQRLAWAMLVLYATTLSMFPGVQLQVFYLSLLFCYRQPIMLPGARTGVAWDVVFGVGGWHLCGGRPDRQGFPGGARSAAEQPAAQRMGGDSAGNGRRGGVCGGAGCRVCWCDCCARSQMVACPHSVYAAGDACLCGQQRVLEHGVAAAGYPRPAGGRAGGGVCGVDICAGVGVGAGISFELGLVDSIEYFIIVDCVQHLAKKVTLSRAPASAAAGC